MRKILPEGGSASDATLGAGLGLAGLGLWYGIPDKWESVKDLVGAGATSKTSIGSGLGTLAAGGMGLAGAYLLGRSLVRWNERADAQAKQRDDSKQERKDRPWTPLERMTALRVDDIRSQLPSDEGVSPEDYMNSIVKALGKH